MPWTCDCARFSKHLTALAAELEPEEVQALADAPWAGLAEAMALELSIAAKVHLENGAQVLLLFFDHEGDRQSVLLDGDPHNPAFVDGPLDPRRVGACADLLAKLPDEARHAASIGCVLLCAEILAQNAGKLEAKIPWVLAVVPEHDESPRLVFRCDGAAFSIFEETGRFHLRMPEEELNDAPADGGALAELIPRVRGTDTMLLLGKISQVFIRIAKSGNPEAHRAELHPMLEALVANEQRLALKSWGKLLEEVLCNALACVARDPKGFEQVYELVPDEVTVPLLAYNVACVAAVQGEKRDFVLSWVGQALNLGRDPEKFRTDPDFASLRGDVEFERLISTPSAAAATQELGEAAEALDFDRVKAAVEARADVNGEYDHDPMLVAALKARAFGAEEKVRRVVIVKYLLEHGAKLEPNDWPWYSLVNDLELLGVVLELASPIAPKLVLQAVEKASLPVLELLLARGLDLGTLDAVELLTACRHHPSKATLDWLQATGVDLKALSQKHHPPLLSFASAGNIAIAEALLAGGAELQICDQRGGSVVSHALFNDKVEFVEWVVGRGADLGAADSDGRGLVFQAVAEGASKCLPVLLKRGAPVDRSDSKKQTALHHAAERNDLKSVELLLAAGANPSAVDAEGHRPVDLATGAIQKLLAGGP